MLSKLFAEYLAFFRSLFSRADSASKMSALYKLLKNSFQPAFFGAL